MNPGISGLSLFYNQYTFPEWKGKGPDGADGVDPEAGPLGLKLYRYRDDVGFDPFGGFQRRFDIENEEADFAFHGIVPCAVAVICNSCRPFSIYLIECRPTRFPSVSWKRAKWPYSSVIIVLGTTIFPPAGSMRSSDSFRSSPAFR